MKGPSVILMKQLTITLNEDHIEICKRFASFRRTLTTSYRLIEDGQHEDLVDTNLEELMEIIPTIEALQFAIRSSTEMDKSKLVETIQFFASVIKSGESWSSACEDALHKATL
jgi:hypothetical protein